ncbi:MAG: hypothetical protein ACJ74W_17215 [Pyrinomonadaceae bacterium]
MEAKDQQPAGTTAAADAARKDEATSSETLSDLEDTQQVGSATDNSSGSASDTHSVPAPDGTPDPDRNPSADGDPM